MTLRRSTSLALIAPMLIASCAGASGPSATAGASIAASPAPTGIDSPVGITVRADALIATGLPEIAP